jgi:signal peptidase I
MNEDREARSQELPGDGYARRAQSGGPGFGPPQGDGVTAPIGPSGTASAGGVGAFQPDGATQALPTDGAARDEPGMTTADEPSFGPGGTDNVVTEDGSAPAAAGPGRRRRRRKRKSGMSWWIELPVLLVFALVLALLIKSFVVQAFYIPSSSMENTLEIGDKVLVNKLVYDFRPIHRGDIVVFNGDGSWDPQPAPTAPLLDRLWDSIAGLFGTAPGVHDYIKRVIGIPGDHVVCCDALGRITVNGVPLNEKSYLYPGNMPSATRFNIVVPPGRLWVMGDHRAVSYDSRGHMNDPGDGTIPENHVVGRAFMIVAPISRWRILPIPATFEQPALNKAASNAMAADPALAGLDAVQHSATSVLGALALPAAPLAAGVTVAMPLTLLERRIRRRVARKVRRRPGGAPAEPAVSGDGELGPGAGQRRPG